MLGAEALVRWQHPKRGLIFSGDFIEIFERTGLIYRLDRYVWELAVRKLAQWQKGDMFYKLSTIIMQSVV